MTKEDDRLASLTLTQASRCCYRESPDGTTLINATRRTLEAQLAAGKFPNAARSTGTGRGGYQARPWLIPVTDLQAFGYVVQISQAELRRSSSVFPSSTPETEIISRLAETATTLSKVTADLVDLIRAQQRSPDDSLENYES